MSAAAGHDPFESHPNLSVFEGMEWEQARSLFHVLFELYPDGVVLIDTELPGEIIVECNSAFARMNGYEIHELIGQSIHILHTEDPKIIAPRRVTPPSEPLIEPTTPFANIVERKGAIRERTVHIRKDGTLFPIEFRSTTVIIGGRKFVLGIDRDISEDERMAAITRSEQALRSIFEDSPDGIVLLDPTDYAYTIAECNSTYSRMNGYTRDELLGKPVSMLNATTEEARAAGLHLLESEIENQNYHDPSLEDIELRHVLFNPRAWHRHKNGTVIPIEYASSIVFVDGKKMVLGIDRDITERRRMEHLDYDRNRVLELIARDAPLSESLGHITRLIHSQIPTMHSLIFSLRQGRAHYEASSLDVPELRETRTVNGVLIEAGSAPPPEQLRSHVDMLSTEKSSLLQDITQHVTPWRVWDLQESRPYVTDPLIELLGTAHNIRIAPIVGGDQTQGILVLWSSIPTQPLKENAHKVMQVAVHSAAIAIEQNELSRRLAHQAEHDVLTGLPNRLLFEDRLNQALIHARRNESKVALMFLDLDGFKRINDTLGHRAGDVVLKEVAERLRHCIRESDTVARIGGDEFTIVLRDLRECYDAAPVASKIIEAIQAPFHVLDHDMYVTVSIGIAFAPDDATDTTDLMRYADAAMYRAKGAGKGRYEFYEEELGRSWDGRMELKTRLRHAFAHDEFELYYQPQIELSTRRVVGIEALIRWKHPKLGTLLPIAFIPAAEENGLILKIGEWVINQSCEMLAQMQEATRMNYRVGLWQAPPKVAVNISAVQFGQNGFFDLVTQALRSSRLPPHALELELTESVIMRNMAEATRYMERLRELGVSLAIDDFGTGYSSLSYLQKLPVHVLKIDGSFIRGIDHDRASLTLVQSIVSLGHSLGLTIVGEGVETGEEVAMLQQLGCDIAQGFHTGRPMSAPGLLQWLQTHVTDEQN